MVILNSIVIGINNWMYLIIWNALFEGLFFSFITAYFLNNTYTVFSVSFICSSLTFNVTFLFDNFTFNKVTFYIVIFFIISL